MNKKLIALALMLIAQGSSFAQEPVYGSNGLNSCCVPRREMQTCCPRTYSDRKCCPPRTCGRRWTGSQRWRNCCGPNRRRCRPKRSCCPRLRCCRPRPACCPPVAPPCDAAPCLQGNGYIIQDENGSFVEEAGIPVAPPVGAAPQAAEAAPAVADDALNMI